MKNPLYAKINDKHEVLICDALELQDYNDRIVEYTQFDHYSLSTVFLGLNHNMWHGDPIWFETLINRGDEESIHRYATWNMALCKHVDLTIEYLIEHITKNAADPTFNAEQYALDVLSSIKNMDEKEKLSRFYSAVSDLDLI